MQIKYFPIDICDEVSNSMLQAVCHYKTNSAIQVLLGKHIYKTRIQTILLDTSEKLDQSAY